MNVEPVQVRTLLGANGFDYSLICLRSVAEYSADAIRYTFHDDGSLTDEQREKLGSIAAGSKFVDRKGADETMEGLLAKYPNCLAARRASVMFLKLFDVTFLDPGVLNYIDSDVLFLRRFSGIFTHSAAEKPIFMRDDSHSYAIRPWRLWPFGPIRLIGRLNAGLIAGWQSALDMDFVEWFLGRLSRDSVYTRRLYWTEQTCWAAMAARTPCKLVDPRQVIFASPGMRNYNPDVVAIHFISNYRGKLPDFLGKRRPMTEPPVGVHLRDAQRTSSAGIFLDDLRRRFFTEK